MTISGHLTDESQVDKFEREVLV